MPAQEGGQAIAEVLLGKISPFDKMALTIPASVQMPKNNSAALRELQV